LALIKRVAFDGTIKASVPSRFGSLEEALYSYSSRFSAGALFSMKILQFARLMEKLLPAIRKTVAEYNRRSRSRDDSWRVTLEIQETGEGVTLGFDGSRCDLAAARSQKVIRLSRRNMARLLFGPFSGGLAGVSGSNAAAGAGEVAAAETENGVSGRLRHIFPLPLSCSYIDLV
jgi:hypothetical protein